MAEVPLTACHIAGGKGTGAFEPRRKNNFVLILPAAYQLVQKTLQTCNSPSLNLGEVGIPYGNEEKYVAAAGRVEELGFTCFDDLDGNVATALYSWYIRGYDPQTGKVGLAKDYKEDCTLISAKPNGETALEWKLEGCWVKKLTPMGDGFNYSSGDQMVMISCTLRYDKAILR